MINNNNVCICIVQILYGYIQMHFTIMRNEIREIQTASGAMLVLPCSLQL